MIFYALCLTFMDHEVYSVYIKDCIRIDRSACLKKNLLEKTISVIEHEILVAQPVVNDASNDFCSSHMPSYTIQNDPLLSFAELDAYMCTFCNATRYIKAASTRSTIGV